MLVMHPVGGLFLGQAGQGHQLINPRMAPHGHREDLARVPLHFRTRGPTSSRHSKGRDAPCHLSRRSRSRPRTVGTRHMLPDHHFPSTSHMATAVIAPENLSSAWSSRRSGLCGAQSRRFSLLYLPAWGGRAVCLVWHGSRVFSATTKAASAALCRVRHLVSLGYEWLWTHSHSAHG